MNLFPNMKIYINTQEAPTTTSTPPLQTRVRTNISRTANSVLSGLIQSVLRRASENGGGGGSTEPPEDIHFYFGLDAPNGETGTATENEVSMIRVLSRATELFVYQAQEAAASTEICSVCRNGFVHGEICRRITACGHFFHHACIDSWFDRNNQTCPVCRSTLTENQE